MFACIKTIFLMIPIVLSNSQIHSHLDTTHQDSLICNIRKNSLTLGDLATGSYIKDSCKSVKLDQKVCDSAKEYIKNDAMEQLSKARDGRRSVYLGSDFVIAAGRA